MMLAFSALYIGDFCVARWDLLLQVMASFSSRTGIEAKILKT